jgi:hypothetical protein
MSSPAGSVRQRAGKDKKRGTSPNPEALTEKVSEKVANVVEKVKPYKPVQQGKEWDYKLAIAVMTVLAFITRFWGIRHPDQVVFDEVHFGKVCIPSQGLMLLNTDGQAVHVHIANRTRSSLPTTCNEPTSSMSILLSENSSSPSLAGSSDTRVISCSRTLAIPTLPTRSHMSHTAPCPPLSVLLPFPSFS